MIDGKFISNKNAYIQFIYASSMIDIDIFTQVCDEWSSSPLIIIGIVDDIVLFSKHSQFHKQPTALINEHYITLKEAFNSPRQLSTYHIFDKNGQEIASGIVHQGYSDSIKPQLARLINGTSFSIDMFAPLNRNMHDIPWLKQYADYLDESKDKDGFILSFFNNVCDSCLSGRIQARLSEVHDLHGEHIGILSIGNRNYSADDIYNMKLALNLSFDIREATSALSEREVLLSKEYGAGILNNVVIFTDNRGTIIRVFYSECGCWNEFDNYVRDFAESARRENNNA